MCLTRKNRKKSDRKLLNNADIVRSISIGKSPYFLGSRTGDFFIFRRKFYENRTYQEAKSHGTFLQRQRPSGRDYTHDTGLKKRLLDYAARHPELYKQTDDDGQGGLWFEIDKSRVSIRLTAPYSDCRKEKLAREAKKENLRKEYKIANE